MPKKGTTRSSLQLPALAPDYFLVDDRDTSDFLVFTSKFAKALSYYNLKNEIDGNWQQLLLEDPIVLLAYIMKTDEALELSRYIDYRNSIKKTANQYTKLLFTQQYFTIGFHIILRINRWYKRSEASLSHHPFRNYLFDIITSEGRKILSEYYLLYFRLAECIEAFKNNACLAKLEGLDRIWVFDPFPCVSCEDQDSIESIVESALHVGQSLFHLQDKITNSAKEFYNRSIQRKDIAPHIGLLLSFLELYKIQQSKLNGLTEKHLNFYFNDVLKFKPLQGKPDSSFLSFNLVKGVQKYDLPALSSFSAGVDLTGAPVTFVTKDSLQINRISIGKYLTLNFENETVCSSQTSERPVTTVLNGLYGGIVKGYSSLSAPHWPFFGPTRSIDTGYVVDENTKPLGFAISCPDLILSGGQRSITFEFTKESDSEREYLKYIYESKPVFNFQLTTSKGWTSFEGVCISVETIDKQTCVRFKIVIDSSAPAVIPYSRKLHKEGFDTTWPVCKVTLAKGVEVDVFRRLKSFKFNQIRINASVKETQSLVMQNDRGKVSPIIPFYPFGNTPFPGANLFLGNQEFFAKQLNSLTLNINWGHLPSSFPNYYISYPEKFENDSFKANLSFFNTSTQQWEILPDSNGNKQFSLFTDDVKCFALDNVESNINRIEEKDGDSKPKTNVTPNIDNSDADVVNAESIQSIQIDRCITFPVQAMISQPNLMPYTSYSEKLDSAFFKLTFSNPVQGFGTVEYPKVLSNIILENGQAIIWNAKNCQSDTIACKLWEEIFQSRNKLKDLETQYLAKSSELDKVCVILKSCLSEIYTLCENYQEQGQTDNIIQIIYANRDEINNISNDVLSKGHIIVKEAFKSFKALLDAYGKVKSSSSSVLSGDKLRKKLVSDKFVDTLISGLLNPFGKVTGTIESELLEGAGKIISGGLDSLFKAKKGGLKKYFNRSEGLSGKGEFGKTGNDVINNLFENIKKKYDSIDAPMDDFKNAIIQAEIGNKIRDQRDDLDVNIILTFNKMLSFSREFKATTTALVSLISAKIKAADKLIDNAKLVYIPLQALPNKPFLPKIKSFSADYTSSQTISINSYSLEESIPRLQFYHLEPYGVTQIPLDDLEVSIFPKYDNIPYAFFGLEGQEAGELLTILIGITSQETSTNNSNAQRITYEYLAENGWQQLNLVTDGTIGFLQSGIISFVIPEDMTDQSSQMPLNYFWLRIGYAPSGAAVIQHNEISTNFIDTQAVGIQRYMNDTKGFDSIPMGTIKAPVKPISEISKILQPISSSGGRNKESIEGNRLRAAYRLKNKNRAVTPSDLEIMVLEEFENLFHVVAIPMNIHGPNYGRLVRIMIVPYTNLDGNHPYRPVENPILLREILAYCSGLNRHLIDIEIVNPEFIFVTAHVSVKYNNSNNTGALTSRLNTDIMNFMSPWLKENPIITWQGEELNTGVLRAFIMSRPYIINVISLYFTLSSDEAQVCDEQKNSKVLLKHVIKPWNLLVPSLNHCLSDAGNMKDLKSKESSGAGRNIQNSAMEFNI